MRDHLGCRARTRIVTWVLHQNDVDIIGCVARNVAIDGFSFRHIRIVRILNEGNVLNVAALSQLGEGATIWKAFYVLGGGFGLEIQKLLVCNWLTWSGRSTQIVFGFALGLLTRIRASS